MFERLTDRARKVMALANQEAQRFNHEYIGTEHIILGLVKEGSGVGVHVLKRFDIDLRKIRLEIEKLVKSGPEMVTGGKLPQTPRAKKVIEYAIEEARNMNHNYVGTEHLLLGIIREQDGVAAQVLANEGLSVEIVHDVRVVVLDLISTLDESTCGNPVEDIRSPVGHAPEVSDAPAQPVLPFADGEEVTVTKVTVFAVVPAASSRREQEVDSCWSVEGEAHLRAFEIEKSEKAKGRPRMVRVIQCSALKMPNGRYIILTPALAVVDVLKLTDDVIKREREAYLSQLSPGERFLLRLPVRKEESKESGRVS